MSRNGPLALAFHALFVSFMLAPILVVCVVAFTPEGFLSLPTRRPDAALVPGHRSTIPSSSAPFATASGWRRSPRRSPSAFAVPAALAIARYRFPGREAMTALFMSPLMIPHVVLGIAFLRFFTADRAGRHLPRPRAQPRHRDPAFRAAPHAGGGRRHGPRIEHAAVSLGANAGTVFRRVTLPLILPGVVSGWALAFINSFDEVTMTVFIAAPATRPCPCACSSTSRTTSIRW